MLSCAPIVKVIEWLAAAVYFGISCVAYFLSIESLCFEPTSKVHIATRDTCIALLFLTAFEIFNRALVDIA